MYFLFKLLERFFKKIMYNDTFKFLSILTIIAIGCAYYINALIDLNSILCVNYYHIFFFYLKHINIYSFILCYRFFVFVEQVAGSSFNFSYSMLFITFFLLYGVSIFLNFIFLNFLGLRGTFRLLLLTSLLLWLVLVLKLKSFMFLNDSLIIIFSNFYFLSALSKNYFEFQIDTLSFSFAFLTLTIGLATQTYAYSYFRNEPHVSRLLIYINMFIYSMLILVFSNNLIITFLGWELIGITSFILINFWSTKVSSLKSAMKAFTFNKFSDLTFLLLLILVYLVAADFTIQSLLLNNEKFLKKLDFFFFTISAFELFSILLIITASIKSAQIIGHLWLPDSMDAPIPASALIHSATLVSAGIYLILKFHLILEYSITFKVILPFLAVITAFFGGFVSAYQTDLKKILAYSTISHCGFLMLLASLDNFQFTIIYLFSHGFFKACSFFCVGNIIRFNKNNQDIRHMGQLWKALPFEFFCSLVCLLNLAGLPFCIGFFSKHFVFSSFITGHALTFFYTLLFCSCFFGIFYSFKIIYYVFFDFKKFKKAITISIDSQLSNNVQLYTITTKGMQFSIFFMILCAYIFLMLQIFYWFDSLKLYFNANTNLISTLNYQFIKIDLYTNNNFFFFYYIALCFYCFLFLALWKKNFNYSLKLLYYSLALIFFFLIIKNFI